MDKRRCWRKARLNHVSGVMLRPLLMQPLSQSCGSLLCTTHTWQAGQWSQCTADCGEGTRRRNVTCTLNGQPVDPAGCAQLSTPPLQEELCYQKPCPAASWRLGPWTPCFQGSEQRNVSCVATDGSPVPDSVSPIYLTLAACIVLSTVFLRPVLK